MLKRTVSLDKIIVLVLLILLTGLPFHLQKKVIKIEYLHTFGFIVFFIIFLSKITGFTRKKFSFLIGLSLIVLMFLRRFLLSPCQFIYFDYFLLSIAGFILLNDELFVFLSSLLFLPAIFSLCYGLFSSLHYSILLIAGYILYVLGCIIVFKTQGYESRKYIKAFLNILFIFCIIITSYLAWIFDAGICKNGSIVFDLAHSPTEDPSCDFTMNFKNSLDFGHKKLVNFLKFLGYKVKFADKDYYSKLNPEDTLVLIMTQKPFTVREVQNIKKFIKQGGSLLAIGDHTNIDNCLGTLNPILRNFGIALKFDTIWLSATSRDYLKYGRHPILRNLPMIYFSVGASMNVRFPARALVRTDVNLFSDFGDFTNPNSAYLGNGVQDYYEQVGDNVLIAASKYGKGRIIALSDSAYFQNTSLYKNYQFIFKLFKWLTRKNAIDTTFTFTIFLILSLLLLFTLLYILPKNFTLLKLYAFFVCILIFCGIVIAEYFNNVYGEFNIKKLPGIALIDMAHNNKHRTYWEAHSPSPYDIEPIYRSLLRHDYNPIELTTRLTPHTLKNVKLFISVAPAVPFRSSEIKLLKKWVTQGGALLIIEGERKFRAADTLIEAFDIKLSAESINKHFPIKDESGIIISYLRNCFTAEAGDFSDGTVLKILQGVSLENVIFDAPLYVKGGDPIIYTGLTNFSSRLLFKDTSGVANYIPPPYLQKVIEKDKPFEQEILPGFKAPVIVKKEAGKGRIIVIADDKIFGRDTTEKTEGIINPDKVILLMNLLAYLKGEYNTK